MKRLLAAIALVGSLVLAGGRAQAQYLQTPMEHSHLEIEVHAFLPYYYGFGFGGGFRVGIPLIPSGFGHTLNNSLALSAGVDLYYDFYGDGVAFIGLPIHVDAQWNVYLTPKFSVFAEAGLDLELHFWSGCGDGCNSTFYPWFDVAVGARYHLGGNSSFPALIARVGTAGFTFGVSF